MISGLPTREQILALTTEERAFAMLTAFQQRHSLLGMPNRNTFSLAGCGNRNQFVAYPRVSSVFMPALGGFPIKASFRARLLGIAPRSFCGALHGSDLEINHPHQVVGCRIEFECPVHARNSA